MAKISGRGGKVMYGSVLIANIDTWSMSGFSKPAMKVPTAFGDTGTSLYEDVELADGGTISFSGNYDPADTNGQVAIAAVCQAGTHLTDLYLYVNTSTLWRVASGGEIIVTKANAVTLPRSNFGTISFEGQVSGQRMEQLGTGT
jgi:hypothetical protein